jgi:hypothetical protein
MVSSIRYLVLFARNSNWFYSIQQEFVNMTEPESDPVLCVDIGYNQIKYKGDLGTQNDNSNHSTYEDTKKPAVDGKL